MVKLFLKFQNKIIWWRMKFENCKEHCNLHAVCIVLDVGLTVEQTQLDPEKFKGASRFMVSDIL